MRLRVVPSEDLGEGRVQVRGVGGWGGEMMIDCLHRAH